MIRPVHWEVPMILIVLLARPSLGRHNTTL